MILDDVLISSVRISLLSLPYKDNSSEVFIKNFNGVDYFCYEHQHTFKAKILGIIFANPEKIPYGLYARKILHYICHTIFLNIRDISLREEIPFKKVINDTKYYDELRVIYFGKRKDFISKITGRLRNGGKAIGDVLFQLHLLLTSNVSFYESWAKGSKSKAKDRAIAGFGPFAIVDEKHKVDFLNNWEEDFLMPVDLLGFFTKYLNPMDLSIYSGIKSAMQLDMYQYYLYENWLLSKNNKSSKIYNFESLYEMFGGGYKKTSQGRAHFKQAIKKSLDGLIELEPNLKLQYIDGNNSLHLIHNPELVINVDYNGSSIEQELLSVDNNDSNIELVSEEHMPDNVKKVDTGDDIDEGFSLSLNNVILGINDGILDKNLKRKLVNLYQEKAMSNDEFIDYIEYAVSYTRSQKADSFLPYFLKCVEKGYHESFMIKAKKSKEDAVIAKEKELKRKEEKENKAKKEQAEIHLARSLIEHEFLKLKNGTKDIYLKHANYLYNKAEEIRGYEFLNKAQDPASMCEYIAKCSYAVSNNKSYDKRFESFVRLLSRFDRYNNLNLNVGEAIAEYHLD